MTKSVSVTRAPAAAAKGVNKRTAPNATRALEQSRAGSKPQRKAKSGGKPTRKAKVTRATVAGHSTSEVGAFFTSKGINPKVARAKLRRAGLSAPYSLADVKRVLAA